MENLINLALNSVFVGNILLAYFLGMCSFLAVSKNMQTAAGLGIAVIFVMTITAPANWVIYHLLLAPGALADITIVDNSQAALVGGEPIIINSLIE